MLAARLGLGLGLGLGLAHLLGHSDVVHRRGARLGLRRGAHVDLAGEGGGGGGGGGGGSEGGGGAGG